MSKPRIVVIGSANTDMVVKVANLPAVGETVLGGRFLTVQGGKGANQAVAAARLGAQVTFVTRLGQDAFGQASRAAYQLEGINLDFIIWDETTPTGVAVIMVDRKGENIIAVAPGANALLSAGDVEAAETSIREADCVLMQLEIPLNAVQTAVNLAHKHHVRVILNPAPAMQLPDELLNKVDVLTPNEKEARFIAGGVASSNIHEVARRLSKSSRCKDLVISMGKKGALIAGLEEIHIPAFKVEAVDTTGAGDAFNGGLTVALAQGMNLVEAVQYANAVGALSTTRMGAQPSLPTAAEITVFLKENNL